MSLATVAGASPGAEDGAHPPSGGPSTAGSPTTLSGTGREPGLFGCPELADETTALLRVRLRAVSLIFLLAFGLFLVRDFVASGYAAYHRWHQELQYFHIGLLVLFGAVTVLLSSRACLNLAHLRCL